MDNNGVSSSKTQNVAAEFTSDNENAYLNRVPDNNRRQKATEGKSAILASTY
jgi:hypothetical protein